MLCIVLVAPPVGLAFQSFGGQFQCHEMLFFVLCRYDIAAFLAYRRNKAGEIVRITDIFFKKNSYLTICLLRVFGMLL